MRGCVVLVLFLTACSSTAPRYDVVIRNGTVYDGSGQPGRAGDVAIREDRVAAVGMVRGTGAVEIDASGMAVAPGFINMLSWATETLIVDGRAMADVKQGVTLEVFGEGGTAIRPRGEDSIRT